MSAQLSNLLIGLGGGAVAVVVAALFARTKTKAETTDIITQAAERVMVQLQHRADALEQAQTRLEGEVSVLLTAVRQLADLVSDLGGDPAPIVTELAHVNGWRT